MNLNVKVNELLLKHCPCLPLSPCYYGNGWFKGIAMELDDANVLANSVTISGTGIVAIIADELKLSWEGKVNALTTVCIDGKKYSVEESYKLEDFSKKNKTKKWNVVGACSFPQAKLVIAE